MARGATIVFTAPQILITTTTAANSTTTGAALPGFYNVSEWFTRVQLDITADEKEDTTFGLTARSRVQGLFDWSFEADAVQDYLSSGVICHTGSSMGMYSLDGLLYDLISNKVKFNAFVKPRATSTRSSDNPEYSGPVRLFTHRGVGGTVGDVLTVPMSFKGSGNFSRSVAST